MKNLQLKLKQMFEEKGEQIVLIGAAALGGLMLLCSLFWPGSGFLSSSSTANAAVLKDQVDNVAKKMTSSANVPSGPDAPVPDKMKPENLPELVKFYVPDSSKYVAGGWFDLPVQSDGQRRQPRVLKPVEGLAASVLARIKIYMLRPDENGNAKDIFVLKDVANAKGGGNTATNIRNMAAMGAAGKGGKGGAGMNLPQMGMGAQPGLSPMGGASDTAPKEHKGAWMPLTEISDKEKLASKAFPIKLNIITFAFPYRAQLDEFRSKLHLPTYDAVEKEMSRASTVDGKGSPNLRFLGVLVERQEVDLQGNPINTGPDGGWIPLNFDRDYKPIIFMSGRETQPENAAIKDLRLIGAVMPRPMLLDKEDRYPDIETSMVSIKKEIEAMKAAKSDTQPHKLPAAFSDDGSDPIFSPGGANPSSNDSSNPIQRPTGPAGKGFKTGTNPQAGEATEALPPEYLLGRIVDVTVEAGKIYQYRLKVRMANPNYLRDDVANPSFAEKQDLDASNAGADSWYVVPEVVKVPADWKYYVGDFLPATRENASLQPKIKDPNTQVFFQIHRWVEWQGDNPNSNSPIGDWAIAEKVLVNVGQYIGRPIHVDLPVWRELMDGFIIPHDKNEKNQWQYGLNVNFAHRPNESVLVDIEGPESATYKRGTALIKEDVDTEAIVLSHDGKLLVYNSARDRNDQERLKRVEHWKSRLKATLEHTTGAAGSNPFGK
jgi:hypothetical protein